ncbi:MAG: hypothetical protein ACYC8S_03730 [Minisyncoccota bacterium]
MKNFFVIYRVPVATMDEWVKNTSPEKMKEQSRKLEDDMMQWLKQHESSFVEKGAPLGKTKSVTKEGITDSRNDLGYYAIVTAESHEAAAKLFADNPHLEIPASSIDVMEIPDMGM